MTSLFDHGSSYALLISQLDILLLEFFLMLIELFPLEEVEFVLARAPLKFESCEALGSDILINMVRFTCANIFVEDFFRRSHGLGTFLGFGWREGILFN